MAKKSATSSDEMLILPRRDSHYQPLLGTRDSRSSEYTIVNTEQGHVPENVENVSTTSSDTIVCSDQPPAAQPPRAPADNDDCEPSVQPESQGSHHCNDELKASRKGWRRGIKKFLLIFGAIFYGVALVISIVLLLGSFNNCSHSKDEQEMAKESVQNNSLIIADLVSRMKFLEQSLRHYQVNQENHSTLFKISSDVLIAQLNEIDDLLVSNVSSLQSRVDLIQSTFATTNSRLTTAENQLRSTSSALSNRLTSTENQLRSTSSGLTTVRNQLTSTENRLRTTSSGLNSRLTTAENRLRSTSSDLSSLKSDLRGVNLFRRCISEEATCRVSQHSNSNRWYFCKTGYQSINRTVSCLCSPMQLKSHVI